MLFFWFLFFDKISTILIFFLALFTHEAGHYFTAKKLGYKLNSFCLTPFGASLNYSSGIFENKDEFFIAISGPFVNIFLSIFLTAFWWIFPFTYFYTSEFVFQSLLLGLFNLLPAYPLDGGRVIKALFSSKIESEKVFKLLRISNIVFAVIFFSLFVVSCFKNFNPTLALMTVFLTLGFFDFKRETRYEMLYFFKKRHKNFSSMRVIFVDPKTKILSMLKKIERSKMTLFFVQFENGKYKFISEQKLINLSLSCDVNTKIEDVLIKKSRKIPDLS